MRARSMTMRNLIKGASTTVDVFPSKAVFIKKSDAEKLRGDWRSIANDFLTSETTQILRKNVKAVLVGKKLIRDDLIRKKSLLTDPRKPGEEPIAVGEIVRCRILSQPEGWIGIRTSEKATRTRSRPLGRRRKLYKRGVRNSRTRKGWGPPVRSDNAGA